MSNISFVLDRIVDDIECRQLFGEEEDGGEELDAAEKAGENGGRSDFKALQTC